MPMVNLLGFKQVGRFVTCSYHTLTWLWRHRGQKHKVILTYGLIVPHLIPAQLLARFTGARVVAILTDPPLTYSDEGLAYRAARALDRALLRAGLRRLDGVVALTPALAALLAPAVPALIMEGIISDEVERYARGQRSEVRGQESEVTEQRSEIRDRELPRPTADLCPLTSEPSDSSPSALRLLPSTFVVMYAGQLHEDYGVGVLLDAFAQLKGDSWALWLYGGGTLEHRIRQAAAGDHRIRFFGFQPSEKLLRSMRRATLMISPRPVDPRSPYQFPSKLIEYLAMGKIVLSTPSPGIPADYYPYLLFFDNMSAVHLAARIREVAGWSDAQREQMEQRVQAFAWGSKTQLHQGERIYQFLRGVSLASEKVFTTEG